MTESRSTSPSLSSRRIRLRSTAPSERCDDLDRIAERIGAPRMVGIGESTHGTREFFDLKRRLSQYLIRERGYQAVVLEAGFVDTLAVDRYVQTGEGTAAQALSGTYFCYESVISFVEWLRQFNAGRDPETQVRVYGNDVQTTSAVASEVRAFFETVDRAIVDSLAEPWDILETGLDRADDVEYETLLAIESSLDRLDAHLDENRDAYVEMTSPRRWETVDRCVTVLRQATKLYFVAHTGDTADRVAFRDEALADNVAWIADLEAGERLLLWAHNGHVKTGKKRAEWGTAVTMGQHLRERFRDDYYAIGLEFGRGSYSATVPSTTDDHTHQVCRAGDPPDGAIPSCLSTFEPPALYLDLPDDGDDSYPAWVTESRRLHAVGAVATGDGPTYNRYVLRDDFDAIAFVAEGTAATLPNP